MGAQVADHDRGSSFGEPGTLVLSRREVAELLAMDECIAAVEAAFVLQARGLVARSCILGVQVAEGGFHIKTAGISHGRHLFGAKVNANFPGNRERHGLPTIQGVVVLFDSDDGTPLAVMDSIEITSVRTAAATAVAARALARRSARTITVCGCGEQGRSQLRALARVRGVERVFAFDVVSERARRYADDMGAELGLDVQAVTDLHAATLASEIIVTCTTATTPVLTRADVAPGTFIAAVGADNPHKHEIEAAFVASVKVVADVLEQCVAIGELHHAIDGGFMCRDDVYGELAPIVAGDLPGRERDDEIIVFDSTGTALEDVAAAALVYERAKGRRGQAGTGDSAALTQ
jgi:ornithine cyclodeaminase/alanine dehydrogenase-like protein (mu-crystallin family)